MDAGEQLVLGQTAATDDPSTTALAVVPAGTFGNSCAIADLRPVAMSSSGGALSFTFANIPLANQNQNQFGLVLFAVSGDNNLPLPGGCSIGLTPDFLTTTTIASFLVGPITAGAHTSAPFIYPPGIAVGTKLYAAGIFLKFLDGSIPGATQTALITVSL
jgi:hypothetical protein